MAKSIDQFTIFERGDITVLFIIVQIKIKVTAKSGYG